MKRHGLIYRGRVYRPPSLSAPDSTSSSSDPTTATGTTSTANTSISKDTLTTNLGGSVDFVTSNLSTQLTSAASTSFKIDRAPSNALVYLDGVFMTRGVDYTVKDKEITFTSDYQGLIKSGSTLSIMYISTTE